MVDFNGFDKGVIGKKLPSDTTLNNMRKADLIELLHYAEHNHRVLAEVYKIAVDTSKCKTCPLSLNGEESYQKGRADAIDEFKESAINEIRESHIWNLIVQYSTKNASDISDAIVDYFIEILHSTSEQLKEQK